MTANFQDPTQLKLSVKVGKRYFQILTLSTHKKLFR